VEALPQVIARVTDLDKKLATVNEQSAKFTAERDAVAYDSALFDRLKKDFARKQEALEEARRVHTEAVKELEIAARERQLREEERERLGRVGSELEDCRTAIFYAEKLVGLFGDFRKAVIAGIRPRLAHLASGLIAEMTDDKYSFVELDPDYNLQIMDFGKYYGIDRFSGGEKDLASLCLRLAISLALTESAGLDRSFVILDEVFGSQDATRRDLIFQALAGLKSRFPQMILITHLEELKHKVETLIEVQPVPGGWSEVIVNGNTGES
jgi:exonuclease SbcC